MKRGGLGRKVRVMSGRGSGAGGDEEDAGWRGGFRRGEFVGGFNEGVRGGVAANSGVQRKNW